MADETSAKQDYSKHKAATPKSTSSPNNFNFATAGGARRVLNENKILNKNIQSGSHDTSSPMNEFDPLKSALSRQHSCPPELDNPVQTSLAGSRHSSYDHDSDEDANVRYESDDDNSTKSKYSGKLVPKPMNKAVNEGISASEKPGQSGKITSAARERSTALMKALVMTEHDFKSSLNIIDQTDNVYLLISNYLMSSFSSDQKLSTKSCDVYEFKGKVKKSWSLRSPFGGSKPPTPEYKMLLWCPVLPTRVVSQIIANGLQLRKVGRHSLGLLVFYDRIPAQKFADGTHVSFLLCEVSPGRVHKSPHGSDFWALQPSAPLGCDSVKGIGEFMPNWSMNQDLKGVIVPLGETKPNPRFPSYRIPINEYILFDPDDAVIRFLVNVAF